jgi:hypothetical protein
MRTDSPHNGTIALTCAAAILLTIASGSSPLAFAASTFTSQQPPLEIYRNLFSATLPSHASVGGNYTVKILVTSHMNESLPILLRLEAPVDAVYVHPLLVEGRISPYGQFLANFTVIPFSSSFQGPLNVTAALSVWFVSTQSRPQLVDSASFLIYDVRPHAAYQVLLGLVGILSLALVAIIVVVLSRAKDKECIPPD